MKAVIATLLGLVLLGSPVMAERIPVEGWYKKVSDEYGKSWKDSGKRTHFHSIKRFGKFQFSEKVLVLRKSESEFGLTILDDNLSGVLLPNSIGFLKKILFLDLQDIHAARLLQVRQFV